MVFISIHWFETLNNHMKQTKAGSLERDLVFYTNSGRLQPRKTPVPSKDAVRRDAHARMQVDRQKAFQRSASVAMSQGTFWSDYPGTDLHEPMIQRVGAGLGKTWSTEKLGPTREPLGMGSPITPANYRLATTIAYEEIPSSEIRLRLSTWRMHELSPLESSAHSERFAGVAHIGHSGELKELITGSALSSPAVEQRTELLRRWQPADQRLLRATKSEAEVLANVVQDSCYVPPQSSRQTRQRALPMLRGGMDELNYRTVPFSRSGKRLSRNMSLPTTATALHVSALLNVMDRRPGVRPIGELLTADGKEIQPIVPRAWKLAAAEGGIGSSGPRPRPYYPSRPPSRAKMPSSQAVVAPWMAVATDMAQWVTLKANQIDSRCEALRHLQHGQGKEPSRSELAKQLPPSHDVLYRRSAMPVGASILSTR